MPKTKVKTAVVDLPQQKRLTHGETISLVLAQHHLREAQSAEKNLQMTLRAQELEAHVALTATRQSLQDAKANVQQAKQKHDRLSDHLATTYQFDWATSGFDPITGQIEDLPQDNAQ